MTSAVALLQQIYDDEDTDQIVYSIREEIIERVMSECYKSYIKKQTINFIVQCAYDAMVKFLCINFYYHFEPPDTAESIWTPDDPIKPSPRDTWAHSAVPIRSRDEKEVDSEEEDEDKKTLSKKSTLDTNFGECMCMNACDCIYAQAGLYKSEINSQIPKPCPSRVKFSPKSSRTGIEEKIEIKEDQTSKTVVETRLSSEISYTCRSTTETSRTQSEVGGTGRTSKEEVKRRREKSRLKELTVEVPSAVERGSQASVVKLPPIRVNTKFTSKVESNKKNRKK